MSEQLQLEISVWFTLMCAIVAAGGLAWLLWSLFWDAYDHVMEQRTRKQNNRGCR